VHLYITATYKGTDNRAKIERLCMLVAQAGWEAFCFVRDVEGWEHVFDDPRELMARSPRATRGIAAAIIEYDRIEEIVAPLRSLLTD